MSEPASGNAGRLGAIAALCVIGLTALAVVPTLSEVGRRGPDEAHYRMYAEQASVQGPGVFRALFRGYVADPDRWLFPNPLRMSFIASVGAWSAVFGASFAALSAFSLVCHLLSVGLGYAFARRFFGTARAVLVAALLACSPLWLGLSRRALLDSFATLTAALAIWTFLEAVRRPESPRTRWLFSAAFATSVLAKETAVLLLLPFAAWLAIEVFVRGRKLPVAGFAAALALPLVACGLLWVIAAGDLGTLVKLAGIILASPSSNEYAIAFGQGPWYRYLVDLLLLAPWSTLLGLAGLVGFLVASARGKRGDLDPALGLLAVVIVAQLFAYSFFTKNVRYVALIELPLRVFSVYALWHLSQRLLGGRGRLALAACATAVALLCWSDYASFRSIFVDAGVYDPMSASLLSLRGFLPGD